ncbi:hypothetical protein HDF16_003289 [Granulicella aggregans]|uniref:HEPN AbiU2-like domain-containing protein n=1 Tax=Granulicella aggregans TaxID=474949 RepID=A0A7W7ZEQ3_9BACT|nr:hypothetical protein [Granulicella aggregans]MBB5058575.1 hypothetical protein [Granulicella aggregans]
MRKVIAESVRKPETVVMDQRRAKTVRQYVVYQLKLIELLHLTLISFHMTDHKLAPENVMGHGADRFVETLLGSVVTAFMSLVDHRDSTNIRDIWRELFPKHSKAIDRVWQARIAPGEAVMKQYRDRAGAHGDKAPKYFAAKISLFGKRDVVLNAMNTFLRLSVLLLKRQPEEVPELNSQVESVLLDIELTFPNGSFNRTWLKQMHLIEAGNFSKRYS